MSVREILGCETLRLDPHHYTPEHRTYEHGLLNANPSRGEIMKWWLGGLISDEKLGEALAYYRKWGM